MTWRMRKDDVAWMNGRIESREAPAICPDRLLMTCVQHKNFTLLRLEKANLASEF